MTTSNISSLVSLVNLWEFCGQWAADSIKDMTREELLFRPAEGRNHAWWLYGHIVVSSEIAPALIGAAPIVPPEWSTLFHLESKPSDDGGGYPDKDELHEVFDKVIETNIAAINQISEEQLTQSPVSPIREELADYFDTCGKIISGFALHVSYHGGQINTIRKMLGR